MKLIYALAMLVFLSGCAMQPTHNQLSGTSAASLSSLSSVNTRLTNEISSGNVQEDEIWNTYTNKAFGFSIKIPKMTFNEMQSEVIAVEDLSRHQVFITTKEYHDEKEDRMKPVTLESLRDPATRNPVSWVIHRATVKNDADLDILFKKEFGVTCSVGEKSSLEQQGIYRIQLNGDGKSRGETQCDPGDRLQLIYVPEKQELFYWIMGNGITFEEGTNSDSKTYDKDMRNSFHVL